MKRNVKRIIIGLLTIILILIMFFFVNIDQIFENLIKISFFGIIIFILLYTSVFVIRTIRLKLIFKEIKINTTFLSIYGAFGVGWAINELTPGKIGDFVRIAFISEKNEASYSKSTCAIAIERFIDLFILFLFSCFTMLYLFINNIQGTSNLNLQWYIGLGAIMIFGAIFLLLILFIKTDWILNSIAKISPKFRDKLQGFLKSFLEGINDFRKNPKKIFKVFILSVPIWLFETLTLVIFFALNGLEINYLVIILAQIIIFFTKTFPITPGGWIVSENAGALLIFLFYPSIPYNVLLSILIFDHIIRSSYIFIYGTTAAVGFNFKVKEINLELIN